jgi:hypothetical protein
MSKGVVDPFEVKAGGLEVLSWIVDRESIGERYVISEDPLELTHIASPKDGGFHSMN